MPIRPRKGIAKRGNTNGIPPGGIESLIYGYSFFEEPFKNDDERAACWKKHRKFILGFQGGPGEDSLRDDFYPFLDRPKAWWDYDAPGSRLYASCLNESCQKIPHCPVAQNILTEKPDCLNSYDHASYDSHAIRPELETTAAYLQRYGLLNKAEKEYLEKKAVNSCLM